MQQSPPLHITTALFHGIYHGSLTKLVILVFLLNVIKAILDYFASIVMFWVTDYIETKDVGSIKFWIFMSGVFCIGSQTARLGFSRINNYIILNLEQYLATEYLNTYLKANKFWLRDRKTEVDYNAIKNGVSAVTNTYSQIWYIIESVLSAFSTTFIMITTVGFVSLPVVISMLIILGIGCKLLKDNYEALKEIEKITNPISTCITFFVKINVYICFEWK